MRKSVLKYMAILMATAMCVTGTSPATGTAQIKSGLFEEGKGADDLKRAGTDITELIIDGSTANKDAQNVFRGIGTVSCNNSSRLLIDYKDSNPESYWEIMKWLFDKEDGAGLSHVKLELGCDLDTSSGAEPATKRTSGETANVSRGAGFMFAHDALQINPDITVDMLCWGIPGWVDEAYEKSDKAGFKARYKWYKETLDAAYDTWGLKLSYVSANRNERAIETDWTIYLSDALKNEKSGRYDYSKIKIVSADETDSMSVATLMLNNKKFRDAVDVIGCHYNSYMNEDVLKLNKEYGKEIWFSEGASVATDSIFGINNTTDGVSTSGTNGMLDIANRIIIGFAESNMTLYEFQPSVASYYDGAVYYPKQLISANNPWSGYYEFTNGLVMTMHFTNFIKKGWRYIESGSFGDGKQSNHYITDTNHDYFTAADSVTGDYSTVITNDSSKERIYNVKVSNLDKAFSDVYVWETRSNVKGEAYDAGWLNNIEMITPENKDGVYTYKITVKPYSMVTLTTTTGQRSYAERKAGTNAGNTEKDTVLSMPYTDSFEYDDEFITRRGGTPKYSCDVNGAFEVVKLENGNKVLMQQINKDTIPSGWSGSPKDPVTSIGDDRWRDYQLSADVMLDSTENDNTYAGIGVRYNATASISENGYQLKIYRNGTWKLSSNQGKLASGKIKGMEEGRFVNLKLKVEGNTVKAFINNEKLTEKKVSESVTGSGRIALFSSYDKNCFDNIKVTPIKGAPMSVERIDDMSDDISYSGSVVREQSLSYSNYGRTLSKLMKKGDTMEYTFTGTGVNVLGANYEGPKVKITLDGNVVEESYSLTYTNNRCAFYDVSGLDYEEHTIKIELLNNDKLNVDAVEKIGQLYNDETGINNIPLQAISFDTVKSEMAYGEFIDLNTKISPAGASEDLTYTTSDVSVAAVSDDGRVYANGGGTATITAVSSNGIKASYKVTVTELRITPKSGVRLGKGEKVNLSAKFAGGINDAPVTSWKSSDVSIAEVDSKGKVTTKKAGDVVITAEASNGYTGDVTLHVKKAPAQIELDNFETVLRVGKSEKITFSFPRGTYSRKVTFKSSNKKVAAVSKDGVVKAKKKGNCKITVKTYNGKKAVFKVKVKPKKNNK